MEQFVGFVAISVGIGAILFAIYIKTKTRKTLSWPSVTGEIISSKLSSKSQSSAMSGSANIFYGAAITYKYTVGKRAFRGSKISAGGELNTSMQGRADERLDKYTKDAEVQVYYDPTNPSQSCLERTGEVSLMYTGIGFFLSSLGGLSKAIKP